jgi:transketolase
MRKAALDTVKQLALQDPNVIFIGSDLGPGVLADLKNERPEQFYMEGIAEQHVIGMSAGMAMLGAIPYVNTIATFATRRCYEQILIDLCAQSLPVRVLGNGGGFVYAPLGPTHQAIEDLGILRVIPNMSVVCPSDAHEMSVLMRQTKDHPGPIYFRIAKGGEEIISDKADIQFGEPILYKTPAKVLFLTTGITAQICASAIRILETEHEIVAGHLHYHTIKPFQISTLANLLCDCEVEQIVIVEEHLLAGGFSSLVLEELVDTFGSLPKVKISRVGIRDKFSEQYGAQIDHLGFWGLTPELLVKLTLNH